MRDYVELLKPRVMSLVVFSGFVGMMIAPSHIHPFIGFVVLLSIALSAGGAAAINMWFDRDIDLVMSRTCHRPIPEGRIDPTTARDFGGLIIFLATLLMALTVNMLAAGLLLTAALFYIYVYTIGLKRRTSQNIVIGGAAGAFPPVIGYAAVTGTAPLEAWLIFLIIFLWTPPHFWALALCRQEDYARANIPMLPVVRGESYTRWSMFFYTLILTPIALLPTQVGLAGRPYQVGAIILSLGFLVMAARVLIVKSKKAAREMFLFSIAYLFFLLCLLLIKPVIQMVG